MVAEPTLLRLMRSHFELDRRIDRIIETKPKMAALERILLRLAAEQWRDRDGNTVLHRVLMACEVGSIRAEHGLAISKRMLDVDPEYAEVPNDVEVTPAEIATLCPAQIRMLFIPSVLRLVAAATKRKLGSQRFTDEGVLYSVGADGYIQAKSPRSSASPPRSEKSEGASTGDASQHPEKPGAAREVEDVEEVEEVEVERFEYDGVHYLLSRAKGKLYTENGIFAGLYLGPNRIDLDAEDDSDAESVVESQKDPNSDTVPQHGDSDGVVEVEVEQYRWKGVDYLLARDCGKIYELHGDNTFLGKLRDDGSIDFTAEDSSDSEGETG